MSTDIINEEEQPLDPVRDANEEAMLKQVEEKKQPANDKKATEPKAASKDSQNDKDKKKNNKQKKKKTEEEKIAEEVSTIQKAIAKQAKEDDSPMSATFSLKQIIGGDILTAEVIRSQIWEILLIMFFIIVYISNRYSVQKDLIEIDRLQRELQDAKYRALSSSSQITEKSRESHMLELLKNNKDSVLKIASQPPYIINVPED